MPDSSSLDGADPPLPATTAMRTFRDVVVVPRPFAKGQYRGGPIWPRFPLQRRVRTCWGRIAIPIDRKPAAPDAVADVVPAGIWCGELDDHFGHMIADFGMRLASSSQALSSLPLVFATGPAPAPEPPVFFWSLIAHFGIARERVLLVDRPTLFAALHVAPQAERRGGGGPSRAHLALLEGLTGDRSRYATDRGAVYVGRSAYKAGGIAGEAYLEDALCRAGVAVLDPAALSLAEQIETYSRARLLIFSEGSAVHALQLVGRIPGTIAVLVRRPHHRIASASLKPRTRALTYLRALDRMFANPFYTTWYGRRDRGIAVLHQERLLDGFARLGIDLRPHWDGAAFAALREADLQLWLHGVAARFGSDGRFAALRRRVERKRTDGLSGALRRAYLNL